MFQAVRIDLVDPVEILFEPPRFVRRFAEHFRQVHVIERKHLADDVEDAVIQGHSHLVELMEQALQDAPLDNRLAVLGVAGHEIVRVAFVFLPDAMDAA